MPAAFLFTYSCQERVKHKQSHSRGAFFVRARAMTRRTARPSPHVDLRQSLSGVERPKGITIGRGTEERKEEKGSRTPKGAVSPTSALACGAAPSLTLPPGREREGAARLPAFHGGSCQGDSWSPRLCFRPGFLGRGRSVRSAKPAPTGERRPTAVTWALPTPACPSPVKAPHTPVVMPAGMMPKAAREPR